MNSFLVLLLLCYIVYGKVSDLYTQQQSGDGTYYGQSTSGACGFSNLYPPFVSSNNMISVALNGNQYIEDNLSEGCGVCIQMQGTGSGSGSNPISTTPRLVFVHDACFGCSTGDIDLGIDGDGRWKITWKAVPCPVGNSPFYYKFQGSNPWYLKLQIVGHSVPVHSVSALIDNTYKTMSRTSDNFWVLSPGKETPFPLKIQITSSSGEVQTDSISSLTNDVLIPGNVQFYRGASAVAEEVTAPHISSQTALYIGIAIGCTMFVVLLVIIAVLVARHRNKEEIV